MTTIKSRKALILPILIMALMIGFTAAYWIDQLKITGKITTGTYSDELSLPVQDYPDNEPPEKDIGKTTAWISPTPPYDIITITVTGAYPGYESWVTVGLHHIGTVPAIIHLTIDNPPELKVWYVPAEKPGGGYYPDPEGYQIHGCNEIFWVIHIKVIEDDTANPPILPQQGTTYTFHMYVNTIQYNAP